MIVNVLVRRLFRWLCLDGNCLAIHDTVFFMNSGAIHPSVEMNDACSPNMCGRSGLRRICLPGPSECRGKARQPGSRSGGRRPSFAQPPPSGPASARLDSSSETEITAAPGFTPMRRTWLLISMVKCSTPVAVPHSWGPPFGYSVRVFGTRPRDAARRPRGRS